MIIILTHSHHHNRTNKRTATIWWIPPPQPRPCPSDLLTNECKLLALAARCTYYMYSTNLALFYTRSPFSNNIFASTIHINWGWSLVENHLYYPMNNKFVGPAIVAHRADSFPPWVNRTGDPGKKHLKYPTFNSFSTTGIITKRKSVDRVFCGRQTSVCFAGQRRRWGCCRVRLVNSMDTALPPPQPPPLPTANLESRVNRGWRDVR
jgi:hypothetical protein